MPLIQGLPFSDYLKIPALSHTSIEDAVDSLANYKYMKDHPEVREGDTDATRLGRLIHCLLLEPEEACKRFGAYPDGDGRTAKIKDAKAAVEQAGLTPVKQGDYTEAQHAADAARANPAIRDLIDAADGYEVTATSKDPVFGALKGRADIDAVSTLGKIIDIKTANDPNPDRWMVDAIKRGYHRQISFYCDLWAACAPGEKPGVVPYGSCIVIPTEAPYVGRCYVAEFPMEVQLLGRDENIALIRRIRAAESAGVYPGYPGSVTVAVPAWYKQIR